MLKATQRMIPSTRNAHDRPIHRNRKQTSGCRALEEEEWKVTADWDWISFWCGENVLELDRGDSCTTWSMYSMPRNFPLEND